MNGSRSLKAMLSRTLTKGAEAASDDFGSNFERLSLDSKVLMDKNSPKYTENDLSVCFRAATNLLRTTSLEAVSLQDKSRFVRNLGLISEIKELRQWLHFSQIFDELVGLVFSNVLKAEGLKESSANDILYFSDGIARRVSNRNDDGRANSTDVIESITRMSQLVGSSDISIHSRDRPGCRPTQASRYLRGVLEATRNQGPADAANSDDSEVVTRWATTTSWPQNAQAAEGAEDKTLQAGRNARRKSAWKIILGEDPVIIDRYPASKSQVHDDEAEGQIMSSVYHPYISNTLLPIEKESAHHLNTEISNSRSVHGHFLGLQGIQGLLKSLSSMTLDHLRLSTLTQYSVSQSRLKLTASQCLDALWSFTFLKAKFGASSWQEMELIIACLLNEEETNVNRVMTMSPDDLILIAVSALGSSDVGNEAMYWIKQRVLLPEFLRILDEQQAVELIWAITWHGSIDQLVLSAIQDAMAVRQSLRTARVQENMETRLREILQEDDGLVPSDFPAGSNETEAIDLIRSQILWNSRSLPRQEALAKSDDTKCIICSEESPQVHIRKTCTSCFGQISKIDLFKSVSPGLRACPLEFFSCFDDRTCKCRPQICLDCIALWVWTCFKKGTFPTCPTCRVKFCLADVVESRVQ
eukprot:528483-Hanusia_phi.AAC.4